MRSEGYSTLSVSQSVSQSVSVSVHDHSRTAGNEAASERYQQLQRNKRSKIKKAILLKRRRSRSHYRGPRCVTQPINYRCGIYAYDMYAYVRAVIRSMRIEPRGKTGTSVTSTSFFGLLPEFSAL